MAEGNATCLRLSRSDDPVRDTRRRLWQSVPALLNDRPKDRCKALWGEIAHGKLPDSFA